MPSLAIVVVLALAAYRAARLVAADSLTIPMRSALYNFAWSDRVDGGLRATPIARAPWRTYLYALVTCQHCIGVWCAVAAYCAWRWGGDVALAILAVTAIAGVQDALATLTARVDE